MKNNRANRMMSYLGWSVLIVIPNLQIQISCLLRGYYKLFSITLQLDL